MLVFVRVSCMPSLVGSIQQLRHVRLVLRLVQHVVLLDLERCFVDEILNVDFKLCRESLKGKGEIFKKGGEGMGGYCSVGAVYKSL